MKFKKNITITTPIFYSNGPLHLGHAYTAVLSDILKKAFKLFNHDVLLTFGADEHGEKIIKSAEINNITPQERVDLIYDGTVKLWRSLDIDYDVFTRTTSEKHKQNVQQIFNQLYSDNFIKKDDYEGYYCFHCEQYIQPSELKDDKTCNTCNRELTFKKEQAYFLNVTQFTDWWIQETNNNKERFMPWASIKEIVNYFVKNDLLDLCITRDNLTWGIKINNANIDKKYTLYVWFDALINYLTATKFNTDKEYFQNWWTNATKIQILGKEITRFHCLYWPIILKMLQLPQPDIFYVHGWIISKNDKMSKSKNNFVYCDDLIKDLSVDGLRYYIAKTIPFQSDHNYQKEHLTTVYNAELVNEISNLASRTLKMVCLYNDGTIPHYDPTTIDATFNQVISNLPEKLKKALYNIDLPAYINEILLVCKAANKLITDVQPWKLQDKELLNNFLGMMVDVIKDIFLYLSPITSKQLPQIYRDIFQQDMDITTHYKRNYFANLTLDKTSFVIYQRYKK